MESINYKKIIQEYVVKEKLWELFPLEKNFQVSFLAQGEYNKNYILADKYHTYVFRINFGSQIVTNSQIDYEFQTLKCIQESGVTPRVFFVDGSKKNFSQGVLIMEFLEGRALDYHLDLKKAAKIFAKIHQISFDSSKHQHFILEQNIFSDRLSESKKLLQSVWQAPCLTKGVKNIFEKLLQNLEKNKKQEKYFQKHNYLCINNTEVNSHNFIIGEKNSYLVDWEKAVVSDPCQDLCHFLAPTTTLWKANYRLSQEQEKFFLHTYCEENSVFSKQEIMQKVFLYQPYLLLRALSWCAFAYVEYQGRRNLSNQDTYQKIEQYLQTEFLTQLLKDWVI